MSLIKRALAGAVVGAGQGMLSMADRLHTEAGQKRQQALADYKFGQQQQLEATRHTNNIALADHKRVNQTPKPPTVETFYNQQGNEYKAQYNTKTGTWDQVGGSKSISGNRSPTVKTLFDEQGNTYTAQYNPATNSWTRIGHPKVAKTGWNDKSVTDYFTRQAYEQLGMQLDQYGLPVNAGESDHGKARQWIADAVSLWRKTGQNPALIANQVFTDVSTQATVSPQATVPPQATDTPNRPSLHSFLITP